jgi:hypothetical protein
MPIHFEANQGQADREVKFLARGGGYSLALTPTEAVLSVGRAAGDVAAKKGKPDSKTVARSAQQPAVLRMRLAGANAAPRLEGLDELPAKTNYFTGKNPKGWRTGVANYSRAKYHQVYPGIDMVYYGSQGQLEYDFVVAPGADPRKIQVEFDGAESLKVNAKGELVLGVRSGSVQLHRPVIYQEIAGSRRQVEGGYTLKDKRVCFQIGHYDSSKPLVIDPVITYSTLFGGLSPGNIWASGVAAHTAADGQVYVYVVGTTAQEDFPVRMATQPAFGGWDSGHNAFVADGDAFVAKFNMAASGDASLVYSTYLGGSGDDSGAGIAVDSAGNAYVTGNTSSTDFPIMLAAQSSSIGGLDAFVTALNPSGSGLIYSTYLGGSNLDAANGVAVDSAGNAYVTGKTSSVDFPVVNAYQSSPLGTNATFVTKMAPPSGSAPASLV